MKPRRLIQIVLTVSSILSFITGYGCSNSSEIDSNLDLAEDLMESHPDSALSLLKRIEDLPLNGKRRKARYALLKSMALDKNYIDTTTFDVLQPAIDYYLKNGSSDERLRTCYYQGRIHENGGEDDLAMQSYLKGLEYSSIIPKLESRRQVCYISMRRR